MKQKVFKEGDTVYYGTLKGEVKEQHNNDSIASLHVEFENGEYFGFTKDGRYLKKTPIVLSHFPYVLEKKGIFQMKEPKTYPFCETPGEKCTMNYCDENGCKNRKRVLVEPKQETLEEAAERYSETHQDVSAELSKYLVKAVFIDGAKWQEQRMYSEADIIEPFNQGQENIDYHEIHGFSAKLTTKEWFEQFKKK